MFTLILCAASGCVSLFVAYKATNYVRSDIILHPSRLQSVVVTFSGSDYNLPRPSGTLCVSPSSVVSPILGKPGKSTTAPTKPTATQLMISMNVSRSQVEQCIDTYCIICRNPVFINEMVNFGFGWMNICVDGVMIVHMCVEQSTKEIMDHNKHGGSIVHN